MALDKKWIVREPGNPALVRQLSSELGVDQTLANLFRFPMIFLSGVFIPVHDLPSSVRPVAYLMPLTYSIDSVRASLGYQPEVLSPAASLAVLLFFIFILLGSSVWILKRRMS